MTPTIRPANPDLDHPFVHQLLSSIPHPPATADEFADWYADFPEEGRRWEWIATDETGRPIAYANTTTEAEDEFELLILVDPAFQRQGIGAQLLRLAEETARAHGAAHLSANLNAENPAACAFAQRFGYAKERHTIDSRLDLSTWEETPGLIESTGVQFTTLATDHSDARIRAVFDLYTRVAPTFPGATPGAPLQPYERWRERLVSAYADQLDLVMLALDGERVVGMTRMSPEGDESTLYTPHTSIDPAYRGRQLGLALKLYAMRVAKARGARFLTTNNDADNHAILAINRKLGYVATMSTLFVGKELAE